MYLELLEVSYIPNLSSALAPHSLLNKKSDNFCEKWELGDVSWSSGLKINTVMSGTKTGSKQNKHNCEQ